MNNTFSHYFIMNSARAIGFDMCGVVEAHGVDLTCIERVENWIDSGYNADMKWFNSNKEARYNPSLLTETSAKKSLIVCGVSYQLLDHKNKKKMAAYAHFADYHIILKQMLTQLHKTIEQEYGVELSARAYVDSAPILERYQARNAGLGWIGRNGLLVNREFGSMFFIASLLIDGVVDKYDTADDFNGCGECRRCVNGCKSGAIVGDGVVDARKCLSYITIEKKLPYSVLDKEIVELWGDSVFGCDACQIVCPWNINAGRHITPEIDAKRRRLLHFLEPLHNDQSVDDYQIEKISPLKRAGRNKLKITEKLLFSIKK